MTNTKKINNEFCKLLIDNSAKGTFNPRYAVEPVKQIRNSINSNAKLAGLFIAIIISVLFIPNFVFSQNQGRPVSVATNNQTNAVTITDGNGGAIIAWQDRHNGKSEIYAQRMNAAGNPLWTLNGVPICTQDSSFNPSIVSDGLGGAIIAWESYRGSVTTDIFAQRVNSSGVVQWTLNGLPVAVVVFNQDSIAMTPDGFNGAIITWQDYRTNTGNSQIYAQRVNSIGTFLWTANGVEICTHAFPSRGPKVISDGLGGAFITWYDKRAGNYDIYTQRIATGGAVVWTTNGVATCTAPTTDQIKPDICSDGAAGVIVVWSDFRSTTDYNIYAQRQGPQGAIVWAVDGIVMNNNVAYDQVDPKIVSDGLGGGVISWTDYRTGAGPGTADIYAQRVNTSGTVQWTTTGIIICTAAGDQINSQLVSDGNNGAYIVWEDHRNAGNSDIYAQRIASNAAITWSANGFGICTIANDQLKPGIVSNGNFGAIVVWQDYRSGNNYDIYMNGFNTTGIITAIPEFGTTPVEYSLSQNYPNPFNPITQINYQLPTSGIVRLTVYNAMGQEVDMLVNEMQNAGNHIINWNASSFPSGVYVYKLESGTYVSNKKMILIK
ncbi:MAG: T9SS type A sorting domain-containing protein [Ignavibacteria bacterium]|nr:T9SS type A sorting domain-containing protein [Ignavibacteria bacterium]